MHTNGFWTVGLGVFALVFATGFGFTAVGGTGIWTVGTLGLDCGWTTGFSLEVSGFPEAAGAFPCGLFPLLTGGVNGVGVGVGLEAGA